MPAGRAYPRAVQHGQHHGLRLPSGDERDRRAHAYGDDICGDGSTDETTAATFGTNTTLRQQRNFSIRRIASRAC